MKIFDIFLGSILEDLLVRQQSPPFEPTEAMFSVFDMYLEARL